MLLYSNKSLYINGNNSDDDITMLVINGLTDNS